jgi:hypothetical protein
MIAGLFSIRSVSQTAPQQAAEQDCKKIKQDIEQLQQDLAELSADMQRLTELLDTVNQHVAQMQADLKLTTDPRLNETVRGELLDTLAKELALRKQIRQQLEDDASLMQATKDEIAGLLSKLANCGPPSATQPPQQETPNQPQQPPKPSPPSLQTSTNQAPSQTAPQQAAEEDCKKIKQDIEQLQQDLAELSADMQRLTELLDTVNQHVVQMQADLKLTTDPRLNETVRGELLDTLAKELALRKQIRQQLEDDANLMQAIKDEIADLLNKLANCPPPSTTEPPKQEAPTPQPPSTTPGTKTVSSAPAPCTFLASLSGGITTAGNLSTTSAMEGDVGMYCGPGGLGLGFVRSGDATVQGTTTGSSLPAPATANFHAAEFKGSVNVLDLGPLSLYAQGGGWAFTARTTSTTTIVVTSPTGGTMTETVTTTASRGGVAPFFGGSIQGRLTKYLAAQVGIKRGYLRSGTSLDQGATMVLFGLAVSPQFPRALLHLGPK